MMDSSLRVNVPLRLGGKKMRKRRELDALLSHSSSTNRTANCANLQDKLLSGSTDDQDDFTWKKVRHNTIRIRKRKNTFLSLCGPVLFILSFSLLCGVMYWSYFDLRQQIYEYHQKLAEVSATNQNLPEALQKWHETSRTLFNNQTIIISKINSLKTMVENLQLNVSIYEASMCPNHVHAKDEKIVANFGAKIESIVTDLASVKEHYISIENNQNALKTDMEAIQINLKIRRNYSENSSSFKADVWNTFKSINTNVSLINNTLSQKMRVLYDESMIHKFKLDELYDRAENITSHVTSINNSCFKYKQQINDFGKHVNYLENIIAELQNKTSIAVQELRNRCNCNSINIESMNTNNKKPVEIIQNKIGIERFQIKPIEPQAS